MVQPKLVAGLSAALATALWALPSARSQDCRRNCRAHEVRDEDGCCVKAAKPSSAPAKVPRATLLVSLDYRGGSSSPSFSPNGTRVVRRNGATSCGLWDAGTGELVATLRGVLFAFSSDGSRIITWNERYPKKPPRPNDRSHLWDATTGKLVASYEGTEPWLNRDGTLVATFDGNAVKVWDAQAGTLIRSLQPPEPDGSLWRRGSFNADGTYLVEGNFEAKRFRLWEVRTGRLVRTFDNAFDSQFSEDGTQVAAALGNHPRARFDLTVWDTRTGKKLFSIEGAGRWIMARNRIAITGRKEGTILADSGTGKPIRTLKGARPWASPDGRRIVTTDGQTIWIYDVVTGALLGTARGVKYSFTPDGAHLIATDNRKVWIHDVATGKLLETASGMMAVLSPDGAQVVSSANRPRCWILDRRTKRVTTIRSNREHGSPRYSPDGTRFTCGGLVYDAATRKPLASLETPDGLIGLGSFSPDGTRILTYVGLWITP
jgi:WD40 repeat protein